MQAFDPLNTSLLGRKLIESSAGTGKTYAIASLYLRLLLERRLAVSQILVVTFTEAATQDLKQRIRSRLREAAKAFEAGQGTDAFLSGLLGKISDAEEAQALLDGALRTLDEAAIFTIHGFCQRVLQEHAFESASLFEAEFITNQDELLREIVDDFWRREFYPASSLFLEYARLQKASPDSLLKFSKNGLSAPFLTVVPETRQPEASSLQQAEDAVVAAYKALQALWATSKSEVSKIVLEPDALKRNIYRPETLRDDLQDMSRYLTSGSPLAQFSNFSKFLPASLARAVKKNSVAPRHPFFDDCQRLQEAQQRLIVIYEQALLALRVKLARSLREELRRRKKQKNLRSFDDLLLDLHDTFQGGSGDALARALRQRYPAALIDEFQDTDPLQYAIFQSIYPDEESSLFLIGDPKQAIYSFRGADVFAYIEASRDVPERQTLDKNWRSSEKLVQAVNTFFLKLQDPFVLPEISYHPVQAARPEAEEEFLIDGVSDPSPLKLWFLDRDASQSVKVLTKGIADRVLPEAVASDIVMLLKAGSEGRALLKGRSVSSEDIAVLVRTNREATLIHEALQDRKVPCVLYSDQSVFASREAMEIERILIAIAEPRYEGKVRAALATDLLGMRGDSLAQLVSEDLAWEARLKAFADYRDLWSDEGFMTMAAAFMTAEDLRSRLLRFPNGERRLTNLLHSIELLHQAALENTLGIEGLLKWLAEARRDIEGVAAEERQIRLETDERAVKIVTIHKSKGLEYPIVYCPFSWNVTSAKNEVAIFHDAGNQTHVIQDLGSDQIEESLRQARREDMAENVRLFYVALTRAKYRCVVAWGAFTDAGKSAMAYLFHRPPTLDPSRLVEKMKAHFETLDDDVLRSQLKALVSKSGGTVQFMSMPPFSREAYVPPVDETESLACRSLNRTIPQDWHVSSFTALVSGRPRAAELPDHDPLWRSREPVEMLRSPSGKVRTFLDFPRGTRAGTALHKIFENLEFSLGQPEEHRKQVQETLARFGFEAFWQEPVIQMIQKVLVIPLRKELPKLTLGCLGRQDRLHEMEFSFPLDPLTPRRLRAVFTLHRGPEIPEDFEEMLEQLAFAPVRGVVKGFVDLIFQFQGRFYLLDWKSNFLGDRPEAYAQESLRAVMAKEMYLLQYHLYTVALDRHLSFRVPGYRYESHFGGIFYLFLRGIDPQRGNEQGIYFDRPSEELIQDLSRCLHAKGVS